MCYCEASAESSFLNTLFGAQLFGASAPLSLLPICSGVNNNQYAARERDLRE
jgi:hypothetical protein